MASLADLLASERREWELLREYKANKRVLQNALADGDIAICASLAKLLPYRALAAAQARAGGGFAATLLPVVAAACARDQARWEASTGTDTSLLVAGQQPPAEHWAAVAGCAPLPELQYHRCYMCRQDSVAGHSLGAWAAGDGGHAEICAACGVRNLEMLDQAADLTGWSAVVTGCRHTVGLAVALRLLRAGARVLGTTRFPGAALLNFAREPDYEAWRGRLTLLACDFLDFSQVEQLARQLEADPPDVFINNAFLTVEQSATYYRAVLGLEEQMLGEVLALERLEMEADSCGSSGSGVCLELAHSTAGSAEQMALCCPPSAALSLIGPLPPLPHAVALRAAKANCGAMVPAGLVAAPAGAPALAAAAAAWLEQQGLALNEHGNLDEAPHSTMWIQKLAETPPARIVEATIVNQLVPTLLLQRAQAAMLAPGCTSRKVIINVTSTEHLHRRPTHAVTGMQKAAVECLLEKLAYERPRRLLACSVDPGFVTGVMSSARKPLTAADGAARVLHPLFALAADPAARGELAGVLVWKDYLPLRVQPRYPGKYGMHPAGVASAVGTGTS